MELKEIENIGFIRYLKIYLLIGVSRAHMFCVGGCCSWSTNHNVSYNPWEPVPISGDMVYLANHHPQQQMMMMGPLQQQSSNPFGNPYGATVHPYGSSVPIQA